jgi:hypothetical protein
MIHTSCLEGTYLQFCWWCTLMNAYLNIDEFQYCTSLSFFFFFSLPYPSFSFTHITPLHLYFIAICFFSTLPLFYSPLPFLCMLLFVAIVVHVKILCWFCYINMLKKRCGWFLVHECMLHFTCHQFCQCY